MTPDPAHIDAVARAIHRTPGELLPRSIARHLLTSTDPAVHAAMLDALTRHGVLTEEQGGAGVIDPNPGAFMRRRLVTPWTTPNPTTLET